jgi:hypothetical protein
MADNLMTQMDSGGALSRPAVVGGVVAMVDRSNDEGRVSGV